MRAATMTGSLVLACSIATAAPDPRLREIVYDAGSVVTLPIKRGVVILVLLDADEAIAEVASGLGGDCAKPEAAWCIAAQPGGRTLFVKAKSAATAANNLAVVTDRRTHNFRFVVLPDGDSQQPVYQLVVKAPPKPLPLKEATQQARLLPILPLPVPTSEPIRTQSELIAERLQEKPAMLNANYSLAEGRGSGNIVPSLVFDDGRFTYLRLAGNRDLPAVFHVLDDGSETLLNTRIEDDLLVIDRISRQLTLRSGSAVVGIWNEAFDPEGLPLNEGTTVSGLRRALRAPVKDQGAPK